MSEMLQPLLDKLQKARFSETLEIRFEAGQKEMEFSLFHRAPGRSIQASPAPRQGGTGP